MHACASKAITIQRHAWRYNFQVSISQILYYVLPTIPLIS